MAGENLISTATSGLFNGKIDPLSSGMYSLLLPVTEEDIKQVNFTYKYM